MTVLRLIAAFMLAAAAAAQAAPKPPVKAVARPAAVNWLDVIVATPEGGFRQGNPAAKVRLLEFGALTCPHCAAFAREDVPILRRDYVATGRVSYEYRPFLLNGADFGPALLVECQSPAAAVRLIDGFYEQQAIWTEPYFTPLPEDVQKQLEALPEERQIGAFAARYGLDGFMRAHGMTRARFDACTSDKANIAKLKAIRDDANKNYGLTAVPTFVINGKTVTDVYTWAALKPALDAALTH
jgi:protein-disulfide isomerase